MSFLSAKDVAKKTNLTMVRINQLANKNRFPGAKKVGNSWVFTDESVEKFKPQRTGRPSGS